MLRNLGKKVHWPIAESVNFVFYFIMSSSEFCGCSIILMPEWDGHLSLLSGGNHFRGWQDSGTLHDDWHTDTAADGHASHRQENLCYGHEHLRVQGRKDYPWAWFTWYVLTSNATWGNSRSRTVKIANPLSQKGSGFFISLFAYDCYHQLSGATTITIFAEVDTLPCAEIQVSIGNRNSDA